MPNPGSEKQLEHRVALVTGGGRGIGRSIARAFAQSGAALALVARTPSELEQTAADLRAAGAAVQTFAADVSVPADVQRFVGQTLSDFGRIDILVNNAGIQTPIGPSWELDPEEWLRTVHVNLGGVFLCCRAVIPLMIDQGGGKIINLSGAGGGALPFFSAYSASKAAVARLTETVASEVAEYNIQVNAIAPGAVRTRMTDDVLQAGARAGSKQYQDALRIDAEGPTPEKAADLSVFLASEASGTVSGRLISAIWDDWRSFPERHEQIMSSDLYTLRRITE